MVQITSGNANLVPEKALTQTYGVVLTPRFFDGLQLSVDWHDPRVRRVFSLMLPVIGAPRHVDRVTGPSVAQSVAHTYPCQWFSR